MIAVIIRYQLNIREHKLEYSYSGNVVKKSFYPTSRQPKIMPEKISCDSCNVQLNDYEEYGIHMREEHNKYYCGACRKEFSNQSILEDHLKYKHGMSPENALS